MAARYALDASALLCHLNEEDGADRVDVLMTESVISTVNYAEVVAKLAEQGIPPEVISAMLDPLHLDVVEFDLAQATQSGVLRQATRAAGLSLGDRSCLALAMTRGLIAVTTDRVWRDLDLDVEIECVR